MDRIEKGDLYDLVGLQPGDVLYTVGDEFVTDQYNPLEVNLDKVEELMTKAGFTKDGDGFWVDADGVRPNADIYAGVPIFADTTPIIAEQIDRSPFVVHRRLLLGKAWVVYFPAPHPLREGGRAFIPDFGRLRFIR